MSLKQRIRRDTRLLAGDREATALFQCLAENLFDPNLDVHFLSRACGASRELRDRLAATVGPLKGYITELRMIEAGRLVRDTDLRIPTIAKQLGYPVVRTFRRAFRKSHGVTPTAMRAATRAEPTEPPDPEAAAEKLLEKSENEGRQQTPRARASRLRRLASLGLLDPAAAGEVRSQLRRRYPRLEERASAENPTLPDDTGEPQMPVLLLATGDHLERIVAAGVFNRILTLPETDLRHAMLDGVRIATSAAFVILQELCCHHTRFNPERAVAVSELGVQLLELHREVMGERANSWKAYAWARLGRVKMLTSDFAGASRALDFAWEEIEDRDAGAQGEMEPWVEVEVRRVEGLVLLHQGRFDQAAEVLDRAVVLGRELGESDPARALSVMERIELATLLSDCNTALELCDELEPLVEAGAAGMDRPAWGRALVAYHRGKAHAATGRDDLAETCWREAGAQLSADQAATEPEGAAVYETAVLASFVVHELARLAGRGRHLDVYEILLRDAIERYRFLRASVFETAAEAELAVLCALRGETDEARRLATSAADFLDALPSHRRAWNAAARLRAMAHGGYALEALDDLLAALCADLDWVRWEITSVQAMAAADARRSRA